MPGLENYEGQWCFIEPIICQKGPCSECATYLKISRTFSELLEEKADRATGVLDSNYERLKPAETFV
jgi:hypothetical protein